VSDPDLAAMARRDRPRTVTRYAAARRRKDKLVAIANALFDGFWLGMFDRESLARFDELHYDTRRERLGDEAYGYEDERWNVRGLLDWEAAVVQEYFPPGARVVVTGAGGGREVLALLERGYDAVGYEPHPRLVRAGAELLERRGYPQRLFVSPRDAFPPDAEDCDAVVVGWGSYTLMPGRARRIDFLAGARARLPDGGPLLVSFFPRQGGDRLFRTVSRTANVVRRVRRSEPTEVGDGLQPNYVHWFTEDEIASELAAAGFLVEAIHRRPYGYAVARAGGGLP
jgi:hypothetical protein